jgi:biotin carboxylase
VAGLAVSKLKQREVLAGAGVPQPRWRLVTDAAAELPVPSVVKAPDRQGQKGLTLVRSEGELPAAVERAVEESRSGVALVEEVVDGPEVTVNAFSVRGEFHSLTVTDRLTAEPPAFGVALAHVWPSTLDPPTIGAAVDAARAAAAALGVEPGGRAEGRRSTRDRERSDLHAAPDRAGRPAGDRGRSTARRRSRR